MNIEVIKVILLGMSSTLSLIENCPELRRLQKSRYYHTSNDLVFADIQIALTEVLDGLYHAQQGEQNEIFDQQHFIEDED